MQQQRREVSFYQSFLPACNLIFDIGANDGHKTAAFLSLSEKVVCCEPDSENFRLLQARFRNKKARVILENKALSDQQGMATFNIHHPGSAFNTLSNKWMKVLEQDDVKRWDEKIQFSATQTVETTTLDRLIEQYGLPGFIKIDVEGFEETVLKGLSQPVPYLSFETLLPDYAVELNNCLAIINSLDRTAVYNIAMHEKTIFPDFVNRDELNTWTGQNNNAGGFEVIVKMSA
ncbi:MAG TPA: FkbM family methyltransferase [Chitinophagaceae bacterium]